MTKLSRLRELLAAASKGPWPTIPGTGLDEDEGYWIVGAVGPEHRFLPGDTWDHDFEKPMGMLLEDEAQRRAKADQDLIAELRNCADDLLAVCEAAKALMESPCREADEATVQAGWRLVDELKKLESP